MSPSASETQSAREDRFRRRASVISLFVSFTLMLSKFVAYELTHSQAILSDALESIVNVLAAAVALWVIRFAAQPADRDHPYGHGKAEYFSAGFEGGAITLAGLTIVLSSLRALWLQAVPGSLDLGMLIVAFAGLANGILGFYLLNQGKSLKSDALKASGLHVLSDFWTTVGVLIGLAIVKLTGVWWMDPAAAIVVGFKLTWTGLKLLKQSGSVLLDAEDGDLLRELGKIFTRHASPGIIRIHHTRVIRSGRYHHVDLHIVIPEFWTIERAHEESASFERQVLKDYSGDGELHAHLDPCRQAYCRMCEMQSCPVRRQTFEKRQPFTLEELTSPQEPEEILEIKGEGKIPPH